MRVSGDDFGEALSEALQGTRSRFEGLLATCIAVRPKNGAEGNVRLLRGILGAESWSAEGGGGPSLVFVISIRPRSSVSVG